MSLRVGLGASQADLDVQGEIDFDFFDENDSSKASTNASTAETCEEQASCETKDTAENCEIPAAVQHDLNMHSSLDSFSSKILNKPLITISCDDTTGAIQKTIETVIPTPFNYKDNKCGKKMNTSSNPRFTMSPRLKSKVFKEENDLSDDSSISSMSESESDVSTMSSDSFETNEEESDSMTDVSPLNSPYKCSTPNSNQQSSSSRELPALDDLKVKKEGVKFTDEVDKHECSKCETIDLQELVKAMKRLKMKQNVGSNYGRNCKSPVLTQNAKCRKNLSFTNEEVRRIDNDNQMLLKKIIAQQNRVKPHSNSSGNMVSPAAVNRQRQQRQIELENLALLKRLESTKPSKSLCRTHLLNEYDNRSSGVLSRASSRSSYPCSSSQSYGRASIPSSACSSAVSVKSSNLSVLRSRSMSSMNKS